MLPPQGGSPTSIVPASFPGSLTRIGRKTRSGGGLFMPELLRVSRLTELLESVVTVSTGSGHLRRCGRVFRWRAVLTRHPGAGIDESPTFSMRTCADVPTQITARTATFEPLTRSRRICTRVPTCVASSSCNGFFVADLLGQAGEAFATRESGFESPSAPLKKFAVPPCAVRVRLRVFVAVSAKRQHPDHRHNADVRAYRFHDPRTGLLQPQDAWNGR